MYKILGMKITGGLDHFNGAIIKGTGTRIIQGLTQGMNPDAQDATGLQDSAEKKQLIDAPGLDLFCYLAFFVSLFILVYYINLIFGTVFNFANNPFYKKPDPEIASRKASSESKSRKKKMEMRTGDQQSELAFDRDLFLFEEFSLFNYLEVISYFLLGLGLTCFSPLFPISLILILGIVMVIFVVASMNHTQRSKNMRRVRSDLLHRLRLKLSKHYADYEIERE